jgi:hypothetical protein
MSRSSSASGAGVGRVGSRRAFFAAGSRPPTMSRSTPILKKRSAGSGRMTSTSASSPSSSIVRSRPSRDVGATPIVNQMLKSWWRS